jgi:putative oxidoreductase
LILAEEPVPDRNLSPELWTPRALAVLRIVTGYLFLLHGSAKLLGFPAGAGSATVPLMSLIGLAGLLELIGGALVVVGLFVRPTAFVLSGEMAVAYFAAHAAPGQLPLPAAEPRRRGGALLLRLPVSRRLRGEGPGLWTPCDATRAGPTSGARAWMKEPS